jgi:hypothetical protein
MTIKNELKACQDQGFNNSLTKQVLKAKGFSAEEIDKLNLSSDKKVLDEMAVMKAIINCGSMSRKDIAAKLAADGLCSEKTALHILSLMKFCKAYHQLMSA